MEIVDPRVDPSLVPEGSRPLRIAEHQPEYQTLPSIVTPTGEVITRWSITEEERQRLMAGEDLYLTIRTCHQPLQPVLLTVGPCDWTT